MKSTIIETPAPGIHVITIDAPAIPGSATAGTAYSVQIDDPALRGRWATEHYSTPEGAREQANRIIAKAAK